MCILDWLPKEMAESDFVQEWNESFDILRVQDTNTAPRFTRIVFEAPSKYTSLESKYKIDFIPNLDNSNQAHKGAACTIQLCLLGDPRQKALISPFTWTAQMQNTETVIELTPKIVISRRSMIVMEVSCLPLEESSLIPNMQKSFLKLIPVSELS
jgi:hypothetical protein